MRYFITFFIIITGILGYLFLAPGGLYYRGDNKNDTTIIIEKGTTSQSIAKQLVHHHLIAHPYAAFLGIAFLKLQGKPLKHGEYLIPSHTHLWDILRKIANGNVVRHFLTIPEGLTIYEIKRKLEDMEILKGDIKELPQEGSLLPQTYDYYYNDSRQVLIKRMHDAMEKLKQELWVSHNNPHRFLLNWDAVLTLASIVEKETALPKERPIVASTYLNRLVKGMRLQADPTVIYAITNGETSFIRPIFKSDLQKDSPYNTYLYAGLPPTPIACPGEASIRAVLNPDHTTFLYFVANGAGGHEFSSTLAEHNMRVRQWRAVEKKRKEVL